MPKSNDIVGTIRIPEAGYGRFWNFMKTMPGGEFTPNLQAEAPSPKRSVGKDAEGTTGRCIVLRALMLRPMTPAELNAYMTDKGKSAKSLHGLLHAMKNKKEVASKGRGSKATYTITAAGRMYLKKVCPNA